MKKSLLALTAMVLLLMNAARVEANGRIYFAGNLATPYIWAWTGTNNVYPAWPGQAMNQLPDQTYYGRPVYYVDIEDYNHNCPDSCIFSDNGNNQTVNLAVPGYDYMFNGTAWMPFATTQSWYVFGDLNGGILWDYHQLQGSGSTLSCTLNLNAGREYYFKIASLLGAAEANYSCGCTMTRTTCKDADFSVDGANAALATTISGNYVFTFDTIQKTLSVTYPDALTPEQVYSTSVPAECGDVLIQAYYWAHVENDSTPWTPFGGIQWTDLNQQAAELGQYFDLVWLAPSAVTADYTGFLPQNYSDQNNVWGNETELKTLINSLHNAGAKVVADIVINHSSPTTGYYQWDAPFNFGQYGTFSPDMTWITKDDEIFISNTDSRYQRFDNGYPQNAGIWEDAGYPDNASNPEWDEKEFTNGEGGPQTDWSYAEYNCVYSRDWAHRMKSVREMCRAYLTWMREYIGYDGWRYDFAKGIHGSHLDDYNKASNAYFSVAECFDGDYRKDVGVMLDAHYNTYVFDFPAKYNFMNNAIRNSWYQGLLGNATNTMLYNYKRNTVTFVDNHDTFREHHNLCGTPNAIGDTAKVIMANAFILAMPGVPCVFYPHWYTFKDAIKPMIDARHITGVHSESDVIDEAGDGFYRATVFGKNGRIRLFLGPNSGYQYCPEGFTPAYVGTGDICVGVYYTTSMEPNVQPVYFLDTQDWGEVNAYMWRDGGFCNALWPGEPMTLLGTFDGHKLFTYTHNEEYYSDVIFSQAAQMEPAQTSDLTLDGHKNLCFVDSVWFPLEDLSHTLVITDSLRWTTLYLPLSVTLPNDVWAYYASSQAGDSVMMAEIPDIPAYTATLLFALPGTYELAATLEPMDSVTNLFGGTLQATPKTDLPAGAVYLLDNALTSATGRPVMSMTGDLIPAASAYLLLDNTVTVPEQVRLVFENGKIPTSVETLKADTEVVKRLQNGQLVIIRDGVMYNVLGTQLR